MTVSFRTPIVSMGLYFAATSAAYFLLPFYLVQGRGYSSTQAGLLFALIPLTMMVVTPFAGAVTDRVGSRWPAVAGLAISTGGLLFIGTLGVETVVVLVVLALISNGMGSGLVEPPNYSAIMGSALRDRLGMASALLAASRQLGLAVGIALAGGIFATKQRSYELTQAPSEALVSGFQDAVTIMAVLALAALLVAALRGRG